MTKTVHPHTKVRKQTDSRTGIQIDRELDRQNTGSIIRFIQPRQIFICVSLVGIHELD